MACAWTVLIMIGKAYVPGALVTAQSLRRMKTQHAIVCMVTADVDVESRAQLLLVYDQVVEVPYITQETCAFKAKRQSELYGGWIDRSFTKWNCLSLVQYSKVILLDADIILLANCDDLFDLQPPAACFSNPWAMSPRSNIKNLYGSPKHGGRISAQRITDALHNAGFVGWGAVVLLEPNVDTYTRFISWLHTDPIFGAQYSCMSGFDEISIAAFECRDWTHIHQRYLAIPWKRDWVSQDIRAYHYHGRKPWDMVSDEWPDLEDWWKLAAHVIATHPALRSVFYATSISVLDADLAQWRLTKDICDQQPHNTLRDWFMKVANRRPLPHWAHIWAHTTYTQPLKRIRHMPRASGYIAEVRASALTYGSHFNMPLFPRLSQLVLSHGIDATVAMALRYAMVLGDQAHCVCQPYADYLYECGVRNEAFASPLDSRLYSKPDVRFYSVFPDVDTVFGSQGDFFMAGSHHDGDWLIHPPVVLVPKTLEKCHEIMTSSDTLCTIYLIVPASTVLQTELYVRQKILIPKERKFFESPAGVHVDMLVDYLLIGLSKNPSYVQIL